jgi:hypothetical protein
LGSVRDGLLAAHHSIGIHSHRNFTKHDQGARTISPNWPTKF